jgi:hypothetical protein
LGGDAFAVSLAGLDPAAREAAIVAEVKRGNVPDSWRRFVAVPLGAAVLQVAPDYLAVGTDGDAFLTPLSPAGAEQLADALDCVLPTPRMVDAIHHAAPLQLSPAPMPPSPAMTSVAVFADHNATVRAQRRAALPAHPFGTLVAGHKKDVVLTAQLAARPGRVAIYGWHRPDGSVIQPLYLGHAATWVDYSHGVRLVARALTIDGQPSTVDVVLADPARRGLLSADEPGPRPRYAPRRGDFAAVERTEEWRFEPGVRAVLNAPAAPDPAKPVRLVVYALPAGNSIEQTIGRRLRPGDDRHFDIQHIGAQLRWLRARVADANLVIVYLQPDERSWVLWRRKHAEHPRLIAEMMTALRGRFPGARFVLTGHSAGGGFTFGLLDGLAAVPDDVERIALLDSNYAYEAAKGHAAKLGRWLETSDTRRLVVLAYEDHLALLNGKTFVSAGGGTWGRSQAMLRDLGARWPFARTAADGLQRHAALGGRVEFLLQENPEKAILHTRQVELNGFIHGLLAGTHLAGRSYTYLGPRVYEDLIAEAP